MQPLATVEWSDAAPGQSPQLTTSKTRPDQAKEPNQGGRQPAGMNIIGSAASMVRPRPVGKPEPNPVAVSGSTHVPDYGKIKAHYKPLKTIEKYDDHPGSVPAPYPPRHQEEKVSYDNKKAGYKKMKEKKNPSEKKKKEYKGYKKNEGDHDKVGADYVHSPEEVDYYNYKCGVRHRGGRFARELGSEDEDFEGDEDSDTDEDDEDDEDDDNDDKEDEEAEDSVTMKAATDSELEVSH